MIVIADEPLALHALRALVQSTTRLETVGAESLAGVPDLIDSTGARVVAWLTEDVDPAALDRITAIRREHTSTGFCLVARRVDPHGLSELLRAVPGGVAVLPRDRKPDVADLIAALRQVARGRVVLGPRVMEEMLAGRPQQRDGLAQLSTREREVLELLALGLRNREIARRMSRSEKLVEKHVQHVFAKLGLGPDHGARLHRRVAAARIYLTKTAGIARSREPESADR